MKTETNAKQSKLVLVVLTVHTMHHSGRNNRKIMKLSSKIACSLAGFLKLATVCVVCSGLLMNGHPPSWGHGDQNLECMSKQI
jgi:hypothetical protein